MGLGMYDAAFFEMIAPGARSSAEVIVPLVLGTYPHVRRVIDVGAGEGWWAAEFRRQGCEVLALDLEAPETDVPLRRHDLREHLPELGWWDLLVCLETAEHLPAWRAPSFVRELAGLAPLVLWSAAIPGQGGIGHENEQPLRYWSRLWRIRGFRVRDSLRARISDDRRIDWWYRQNVLVLEHSPDEPYVAPEQLDLKPDAWD